MKRLTLLSLMAMVCCGCQAERFTTQPLGDVNYADAFKAARDVLAQYFSVALVDPDTGKIVARPKPIESPKPDRLLWVSTARELATLRIRQEGQEVFADISVQIQRQDLGASRSMQPVTVNNELPSRTPAQESGPLSAEQEQAWQNTERDYALERTILNDLLTALGKGKSPTTLPAIITTTAKGG